MTLVRIAGPQIRAADTRTARPPPKKADPELLTPDWKAMRERVRREANGMCQAPGCRRPGRYVDHIVERKDGGAMFLRANLMLVCAPCHQVKTNAERAKRMRHRP
jgi:5-methylcytosine-specific restriction endonuclease McrA